MRLIGLFAKLVLLVQIGALKPQLTAAKSDSGLENRLEKIEVQIQGLTSELQEHKRRHELVCDISLYVYLVFFVHLYVCVGQLWIIVAPICVTVYDSGMGPIMVADGFVSMG